MSTNEKTTKMEDMRAKVFHAVDICHVQLSLLRCSRHVWTLRFSRGI